MKVINKLESYPTGDMIVPYCPNCDNPTYSERKCPFCNTELEYEEIIEKDKEIKRLNNIIDKKEQFLGDNIKRLEREVVKRDNIINELEKWLEEDLKQVYRDAGHRHNLILEVLDKLQELKGSNGTIPPEVIGTNGENGGLFDYGDR